MFNRPNPYSVLAERIDTVEKVLNGTPVPTAAADLGIDPANIHRWLQQMGTRMRMGARRAGATNQVNYPAPAVYSTPATGHGHRLQLADRLQIQMLRQEQGQSVTRIAQYNTDAARARPKPRTLDTNPRLRELVVDRLAHGNSPEQIAIRLPIEFPQDSSMRISHETIYLELYRIGATSLRTQLDANPLRSGRTKRKPAPKLPGRGNRSWVQGPRLSDRDKRTIAEHASRAVSGHWEGDLVVGPDNSAVITLVDRASRYTLLGRLPGMRTSAATRTTLTRMVAALPADWFRSITWDQGNEMARHAEFTGVTGCPVFFCEPHSPWQRPTNENFNRQLRWEYPKGTDFNKVTGAELRQVQNMLNDRPRKIIGGYTPQEVHTSLVNNRVALTA